MYKYSAPIYNTHITANTRAAFLQTLREAKIERVFLIAKYDFATGEVFHFDLLCENIAWLRKNGIQPAIWVGETIGHGGLLHDDVKNARQSVARLRNFDGEELPGTRCPLDKSFQAALCTVFRKLAATGAAYILIDDDFRISQHGKTPCCVCELHLREIARHYGSSITREAVRDSVMQGHSNTLRDAYLQAMGDSLRTLAKAIRTAVDEVDDTVGLSLCSCHCHWDIDGIDPVELTHIFAGKKSTPLLRLHGAPYWAAHSTGKDLPHVFEHARMFAALARGNGFELMNELDTYPRPRHNCPASFMELTDAVMRADNTTHGALKYMYDYVSSLSYETGYLAAHCRDLATLHRIEEIFCKGKQAGVHVCVFPHLIVKGDSDLMPPHDQLPRPMAGMMLSRCSIPTTYTESGLCRAVFGQGIDLIPDTELDGGLVLDAESALLLCERGVDVGLEKGQDLRALLREYTPNRVLRADHSEQAVLVKAAGTFLAAKLRSDAEVHLTVSDRGKELPLCYTYENAAGQRFLVWLFHAGCIKRNSDLTQGYLIQKAMTRGIEWISKKPLPVKCEKHPQLYIMCREGKKTLTVGLFNCFADYVFAPVLTLNDTYREITQAVNTSGIAKGNTVTLSDLPPFSFCAFEVTK